MHWFKIHHGYSSDAKLALAAHKLQAPRATINGIFLELLEYASKQEERGSLVGYNIEVGALAMGVTDEFMNNVIVTLRNVTLVTSEKVVNWDRYQGGADATAAERQRRHREKKKQQLEETVTPVTVTSPLRNVEKSRVDKKEKGTRFALDAIPLEWREFCKSERPDLNPDSIFAGFADYWVASPKGVKLDWFATWRNWVRNQKANFNAGQNQKPQRAGVKTL